MRQKKLVHRVNDSGELVFGVKSDKIIPIEIFLPNEDIKRLNLQRYIIRQSSKRKTSDLNKIPRFK